MNECFIPIMQLQVNGNQSHYLKQRLFLFEPLNNYEFEKYEYKI